MLQKVINPGGREIVFYYDALGRRTAKISGKNVTRFVWDGNVPLHEWTYEGQYPPIKTVDAEGIKEEKEPTENIVTWVYEEGSFVPCGKFIDNRHYSIIADYLGTPTHCYDETGKPVWERELDIYGAVRKEIGEKGFVPQLYQGQYVDEETGLAYNRFRYYDSDAGNYISQDPISLEGNNPTLYGYVKDINTWVDFFGLHCSKKLSDNLEANGTKRPPDTIAHHIVGSGKRAKPAKDILTKHGIDIDSHKNGVFLPDGPNSKAPGHMHTGRHTNDYLDKVNQDIINADKIGGKTAVEKQLEIIREQLLNKKYTPLQK